MLNNIWFIAAIWMGLALVGSLISIWTGVSVALIEILVGVVAGNIALGFEGGTLQIGIAGGNIDAGQLHHVLQSTEWTNFLAMLGAGVLTFLAGAEIDPHSLKANWRASVLIGILSFAIPFAAVWFVALFVFGWSLHQAQIAGIALSTTSVAVVYAVMIEGGLSDTSMGKMILAACFVTDLGTVLALGGLFANFDIWLLVFVAVTVFVLWFMPRWTQSIITRLGATRVSEPEVKFIFFVLFFLGGLATTAKSEAVLPAYLVGLVVAGVFLRDKTLVHRMRSIAFAMFTPFYFIKAGLYVSMPALWSGLLIDLCHAPHGDRSNLWNDFSVVWIAKPHHQPDAIHDSGQHSDLECIRADPFRPEILSAKHRNNARLGTNLPKENQGIRFPHYECRGRER